MNEPKPFSLVFFLSCAHFSFVWRDSFTTILNFKQSSAVAYRSICEVSTRVGHAFFAHKHKSAWNHSELDQILGPNSSARLNGDFGLWTSWHFDLWDEQRRRKRRKISGVRKHLFVEKTNGEVHILHILRFLHILHILHNLRILRILLIGTKGALRLPTT